MQLIKSTPSSPARCRQQPAAARGVVDRGTPGSFPLLAAIDECVAAVLIRPSHSAAPGHRRQHLRFVVGGVFWAEMAGQDLLPGRKR
jgi:hypothetical protein